MIKTFEYKEKINLRKTCKKKLKNYKFTTIAIKI
jgi:hypothetical protein